MEVHFKRKMTTKQEELSRDEIHHLKMELAIANIRLQKNAELASIQLQKNAELAKKDLEIITAKKDLEILEMKFQTLETKLREKNWVELKTYKKILYVHFSKHLENHV